MAKYLILIYGDAQQWAAMTEAERGRLRAAHGAFAGKAGTAIVGGHALEPAPVATTVRAGADGTPTVTDGPFLEAKEAVGGYYLLEAADLDEVIDRVSQLYEVTAGHSGVEIRPVIERE